MYINCLNPAFSTTDNGCISHVMKLPIASTTVCHCSLSFGSGLTHSITFCSVGYNCSTSLSFSPSAFNNSAYQFALMVSFQMHTKSYNTTETSDKQSRQTALSFTGVPSSLLKTQNVSTRGFYPQGYALFYFPTPFLQLSNSNAHA